jgi:hypothetical protein
MTRSAQEVVEAHLDALVQGDPAAILKDFRDDALVVTPQGALEGLSGVEAFFTQALTALPELKVSVKSIVYAGDIVLLQWTAASPAGHVNDGVDTFVVEDGAIKVQTSSFSVEPA